jgi:predicted O-methyltransferase YrrM/heme-degrading monooxygenase HmoA
MFIAMNRFQVKTEFADSFEKHWRERESFLDRFSGFIRFRLLRSEALFGAPVDVTEFVSHSEWLNQASFEEWLHSDFSRKAHGKGGSTIKDWLTAPPKFSGYNEVMDQVPGHRTDFRSVRQDLLVEEHFSRETVSQKQLLAKGNESGLPPISVGAFEGRILEILLRAINAKRGIEFGTLGGYSASWLARALPADGELLTLELDPKRAEWAQLQLDALKPNCKVRVLAGDAMKNLETLQGWDSLDFVFIDADKNSYAKYAAWALPRLRKGGLILADNAYLWGAMNYFGKNADELTPPTAEGLHAWSQRQFEGMSDCWKLLSTEDSLASIILPTGEGLGIAIKI